MWGSFHNIDSVDDARCAWRCQPGWFILVSGGHDRKDLMQHVSRQG